MKKRIIALVLTCMLILGMIPASASGAVTQSLFQDVNGHWGQEAIERFAELGIVQGHQGRFNPDKAITRGELAVILDNIMNYQTMANSDLVDIGDTFYTEAVLKVNAAKVMFGFDKKFRPTEKITREEAIVTLSRAFGITLTSNKVLSMYRDSSEVSSWASEALNSMVSKKYINGYKGKLLPKSIITRAEVVTILDNVMKALYSENGEYTASVDGTAIISAKKVTLKDLTIKGDLIITEGAADGEITLDNVTVEGNTILRGGGVNSIIIKGYSNLTNMTVESKVTINNKGTISYVTVKANGVTILGNIPMKVVVNATVTEKPIDSRGKEVTPTVVTPNTTPPVKDPANTKVPVVKGAEVIVKGEDDRWTWFQNGTPLLILTIPDNSSIISHYSILASKDGGEWKVISNEFKFYPGIATEAIDLVDVLNESGLYKFKIVSYAQNTDEYSNNEIILADTFKLIISNEELVPKVFIGGWRQNQSGQIEIKQLETNKLYRLYFFDNKDTKFLDIDITSENGAIYMSRDVHSSDENNIVTKIEIESIKIRKIDATETREGVDLVVSKLQETTIPVEISSLPIDPVYPEFGEYLPTVIDLSTIFNADRGELNYAFKFPTDLSEFVEVTFCLYNSDGTDTHIVGIYLDDNVNKAYLAGTQREFDMIYGLLRQEKTVTFTKMGIISEPSEESGKLASITCIDTNITVNVAENPLAGYEASISLDESGERVVKIIGLESDKKYCVGIMNENATQDFMCQSNNEGIITLDYYGLFTRTGESKVFIQKYEVIADSNKYTINVTPKGKDGVSINLNGY